MKQSSGLTYFKTLARQGIYWGIISFYILAQGAVAPTPKKGRAPASIRKDQIKIKVKLSLLELQGNKTVSKVGEIPANSIVDIPSKYDTYTNGRYDYETSLQKWLTDPSVIRSVNTTDGKTRLEYLVPIQLQSDKKDSSQPVTYYINLASLSDKEVEAGHDLRTSETSSYYGWSEPMESDCNDCQVKGMAQATDKLLNQLGVAQTAAAEMVADRLAFLDSDFSAIFKQKCGISMERFYEMVKVHSNKTGIPVSYFFALMSVESASSGLCQAVRKEDNGSRSYGLFQLNTKSIPLCSQIRTPNKGAKSNRACVDRIEDFSNPATNLALATRLISQNARYLKSCGYNMGGISEADQIRLLMSAHKAGHTTACSARKALETVTGRPNSTPTWKEISVTMLRSHLSPAVRKAYGDNGRLAQSSKNASETVSYVEAIAGSDNVTNSLQQQWSRSFDEYEKARAASREVASLKKNLKRTSITLHPRYATNVGSIYVN